MKVLFIVNEEPRYISDLLIHGFISLNHEVYLTSDKNYLFQSKDHNDYNGLYGRGFTYTSLLPNKTKRVIQSEKIKKNLKTNNYDLIIYSEFYVCNDFYKYLIKRKTPIIIVNPIAKEIELTITQLISHFGKFFIRFNLSEELNYYLNHKLIEKFHNKKKALYFTRFESKSGHSLPIQFSVPKEKIRFEMFEKTKLLSTIIPNVISSYNYQNENEYYGEYRKSYFAITHKKYGWDSLRHYEILVNNCIPYFPDIEHCPDYELFLFPKSLIMETNKLYEDNPINMPISLWKNLQNKLLLYSYEFLTTEYSANYIIKMYNQVYDDLN